MKNKYKKPFGFSLLELLIILAITAMLVQLAIPSYQNHIQKAKQLETQVQEMEKEIFHLTPQIPTSSDSVDHVQTLYS